jgi:hypothetical protein
MRLLLPSSSSSCMAGLLWIGMHGTSLWVGTKVKLVHRARDEGTEEDGGLGTEQGEKERGEKGVTVTTEKGE